MVASIVVPSQAAYPDFPISWYDSLERNMSVSSETPTEIAKSGACATWCLVLYDYNRCRVLLKLYD